MRLVSNFWETKTSTETSDFEWYIPQNNQEKNSLALNSLF